MDIPIIVGGGPRIECTLRFPFSVRKRGYEWVVGMAVESSMASSDDAALSVVQERNQARC